MKRIINACAGLEMEKLAAPFGFKGKSIDTLWQSAACVTDEDGLTGVGPAVQSVVWSDAGLFDAWGDSGGNAAMFMMTRYAAAAMQGRSFSTPWEAREELFPAVFAYAKRITGMDALRPTCVLNAMVGLDFALWQLYVREKGLPGYDAALPDKWRSCQARRHRLLGEIPLVSYGVGEEQILSLARQGAFLLKIKIGADPDKDGDQDKMLAWDKARLARIHGLLAGENTPYTDSGRIAYYLDANGRYGSRDRLMRLLDHLDAIGALPRVALLEEPFPEGSGRDVSELPVRVAADESAHSLRDADALMDLGYGAMALKPVAKTLSLSLEIAARAKERGVPCFCADLTVNPLMVDWNKCVAARLDALPGMKIGVVESNGRQNYAGWARMQEYHPMNGAGWIRPRDGVFHLDEDFYRESGGVFRTSPHYAALALK